jgi:hypothetical protein
LGSDLRNPKGNERIKENIMERPLEVSILSGKEEKGDALLTKSCFPKGCVSLLDDCTFPRHKKKFK